MTTTATTFATAPRDLDGILKLGRFHLRSLGEEIPAWENGDEKQAFLKLGTEGQADAIFKAITERDKREKGSSGKAAAGAGAKATTRTPVTSKGSTAAPKTDNAQASGGGAGQNVGENTAVLFALLTEIKDTQARIEERLEAVEQNQGLTLDAAISAGRMGCVSVSLALQMSEQTLNAPAEEVLKAAIEQMPTIEPLLAEVTGMEPRGEESEGNG